MSFLSLNIYLESRLSEGYHPDNDDSPQCNDEDYARYRSIIGCCVWIIVRGHFDIAYSTSAMTRFNMLPREGHLKAVKSILRPFQRDKSLLIHHTQIILYIQLKGIRAEEEVPNDLPSPKRPKVRMTVHVDADHAHDLS